MKLEYRDTIVHLMLLKQRWERTSVKAEFLVLRFKSLPTVSLTDKMRRSEQSETAA